MDYLGYYVCIALLSVYIHTGKAKNMLDQDGNRIYDLRNAIPVFFELDYAVWSRILQPDYVAMMTEY